ncbi:hypothetical protein ACTXT7_002416 [Hymenolepis weldensis]
MRTKLPATVVFGGVRSEGGGGQIMTPPFFPRGLRINSDAVAYVETLQIIIKPPWISGAANGGRSYVFQQDLAPLIKLSKPRIGWPRIMSHQTYDHLLVHQTLILWIITCGAGCGVVEKEVNKHPHNTKSFSLIEAIA